MLFQKLVKQHRVHLVVADAESLAIFITRDEIRIQFFYLFGNESEASRTTWLDLCLVAETDRVELVYYFAGLLYRFDLVLETARRNQGAEFSLRIYINGLRAARLLPNAADV